MLDWLARQLEVSPAVAAMLVLLVVLQLAAQIYALVDLTRRGSVRGGRKWVWLLVILLGNLPGAIAYLAAGRTVHVEQSDALGVKTAGEERVHKAIDTLYGPRNGAE